MTSQIRRFGLAASIYMTAGLGTASAHPHVFMSGGLDFVISEGKMLDAVNVTWIYDEFETLYILSHHGLALNADGVLDEEDRLALVGFRNQFPDDFDGSAHLTVGETYQDLALPQDLDAHIVDGRMTITFTRPLATPVDLSVQPLTAAFYESTFFFAFTITEDPQLLGPAEGCAATLRPYDPDAETSRLKEILSKLGREETPKDATVGAYFADRVELSCG